MENFAVISDTHSNRNSTKKALEIIKNRKINIVFHCGDIGGRSILEEMEEIFEGKIFAVLGNMDEGYFASEDFQDGSFKNIILKKDILETQFNSYKIAIVHFQDKARQLAETGKYDFVFHGHTHKPWKEKIGKCVLLCPGNIAGLYFPPTFALFNSKDFELIRL